MSYLKELVPIENRAIKVKLLTLKVYQFALIELSIFPILITTQYCFDFLFVFMFWYHDKNINIIVVQKTFPWRLFIWMFFFHAYPFDFKIFCLCAYFFSRVYFEVNLQDTFYIDALFMNYIFLLLQHMLVFALSARASNWTIWVCCEIFVWMVGCF